MIASSATEPLRPPTVELRPPLEPHYGVRARHLPLCVLFALMAVMLSHVPLRHTDVWGHVTYGKWIVDNGRLPTEDPFMPLASGMPLVDTSWLSQVILAAVDHAGGAEGLSILFTCTTVAIYLILAWVFYLQTRSAIMAFSGTFLALVFGWSRLTTIRPEMFAALLFVILLWLLTPARSRGRPATNGDRTDVLSGPRGTLIWLAVPTVMLLWANLHGSFVCGVALLACCLLGRAFDVALGTRSIRRVLTDGPARRWLILTELAVAATLVNPYGAGLLFHVVDFPLNPAVRTVSEWAPLVLLGTGGPEFALSWVLLVVAMRHSRRRVHAAEVLLLATFSVAAVAQLRMMTWYAPVFVWVLVPHLDGIVRRRFSARAEARRPATITSHEKLGIVAGGWLPTLAVGLIIWAAFWLSGFSDAVLTSEPRPPRLLYSAETPRQLSAWLKDHRPSGQVFNASWWGDWLVYDTAGELSVFVTSHVHVIPPHVWADYVRVERAGPGWESTLARYGVGEVIVDKQRQRSLAAALRNAPNWRGVYEDQQAIVYRKRPSQTDQALAIQEGRSTARS